MELKQLCNIHGMLVFKSIEEEIIRHPAFNRLADIKQLGYTYKGAYKCATHTRLSHSLGVAHLAKEILKYTVEKNRDLLDKSLASYPTNKDNRLLPTHDDLDKIMQHETLLSVAALLHDINHTPFAHTIQTHLKLSDDIIQSEKGFSKNIDEFSLCKEFNLEYRENVKNILMKSRHNQFEFAELFYTLIRGDLGASTIDFIQRDHHEAGHRRIGLFRVLEGFILVKVEGKIKIALDLISSSNEILTSIHNLLFNRYKLSATIYFHKSNISAEAMIGKALRHMILAKEEENNLCSELDNFIVTNKTDYHFFIALEKSTNNSIKELGLGLQQRNIYDIAYYLEWTSDSDSLIYYLCEQFRGRENYLNSFSLEYIIAHEIGLNEDDIIVHCCDPDMYGFDIDNFLVVEKGLRSVPFKEATRGPIESEYDSIVLLKKLHKKLWKFYVLCKRVDILQKDEAIISKINTLCRGIFKDLSTFKAFLQEKEPVKYKKQIVNTKQKTEKPKLSTKLEEKEFHIAVSFPGEKREYVKAVVEHLSLKIERNVIFYDRDYTSHLAQPNSDLILQSIYYKQSKLIVVFLCEDYEKKQWCALEWRAIRDLIKSKKGEQIMLIRFDNAVIEGIFSHDGYIDANSYKPEDIAKFVLERIDILLTDVAQSS